MKKEIELGKANFGFSHRTQIFCGPDDQGNETVIKLGDALTVIPENIVVPGRKAASRQSGRIQIGRAAAAPFLTSILYADAASNVVYGTIELGGETVKFMTDGKTVSVEHAEINDYYEEANAVILPLAAWYESADPDTMYYRKKAEAKIATTVDCWRYSEAFYYGYLIPTKKAEIEYDAVVTMPVVEKAKPKKAKSRKKDSILPWRSEKLKDIPNDFSVTSCMEGKYRLPYRWGIVEEDGVQYDLAQDVVPVSFLDGYVDNQTFRSTLREIVGSIGALMRTNDLDDSSTSKTSFADLVASATKCANSTLRNKLLVGEPGTGKTMLVQAIAAALGFPCAIIRLSALSEIDVITEEVRVTDDGFKSIKSKCFWMIKHGGIVCFDDMSNADPNTFFAALGGTLEAPFQLQVGQKFINRHPLSIIFATANVGTNGSRSINEALLTRFPNVAYVEKLNATMFKKTIGTRALRNSGADLSDAAAQIMVEWSYAIYTKALNAVKLQSADLADKLITLRAPIALCETLMNEYADEMEMHPEEIAVEIFANVLYAAGEPEMRDAIAEAIRGCSTAPFKALN